MKSDVRRHGRRRFEEKLSHVVQSSDSAGRRITVAWSAHRFVFLFGSLPSWTRRRAIDTDAERAERRRILVANSLEIASRVAHAALVTTIGAMVLLERQRF